MFPVPCLSLHFINHLLGFRSCIHVGGAVKEALERSVTYCQVHLDNRTLQLRSSLCCVSQQILDSLSGLVVSVPLLRDVIFVLSYTFSYWVSYSSLWVYCVCLCFHLTRFISSWDHFYYYSGSSGKKRTYFSFHLFFCFLQRLQWNPWFLVSAWLSLGCCAHLDNIHFSILSISPFVHFSFCLADKMKTHNKHLRWHVEAAFISTVCFSNQFFLCKIY